MPDAFVNEVTERYIELYENITGESFERGDYSNVMKRIEDNVNSFLSTV
jgi:phosphoribosylaminoimidazole-succinocarboxamide synthase